jgi:hypothetical protein
VSKHFDLIKDAVIATAKCTSDSTFRAGVAA